MRIKTVHIENFKRFTDLKLSDIPEKAKLILLIGANGSGKSSVFDAFQTFAERLPVNENGWYRHLYIENHDLGSVKDKTKDGPTINIQISGDVPILTGRDIPAADLNKHFIGRPSIRILPRIPFFKKAPDISENADKSASFIDTDNRFENDINAYISDLNSLISSVFKNSTDVFIEQVKETQERLLNPINLALLNIFGEDARTGLKIIEFEPMNNYSPAKLWFSKGTSKINYDDLSHGEKQVVILLLNFLVRKKYYENAIIFIDEMDCHLNTALQEVLLQEIVENWIPESAQLWTASHALGFISYAHKSEHAAIFDFDNLDFDQPQQLIPKSKEQLDVFEIAVPRETILRVFKEKLVLCENLNDKYYNLIGLPDIVFAGVSNAREIYLSIRDEKKLKGIRDRDFLTDEEILKIEKKYPNLFILRFKNFENYLYHPENLRSLHKVDFDHEAYLESMIQKKNATLMYKLLDTLDSARKSYAELSTHSELKSKSTASILDASKSDDPNEFLKFFDCKLDLDKSFKTKYKISDADLAKTAWFKEKIAGVLKINV